MSAAPVVTKPSIQKDEWNEGVGHTVTALSCFYRLSISVTEAEKYVPNLICF